MRHDIAGIGIEETAARAAQSRSACFRAVRAIRADERGSALAAVIGVMAVGLVLTSLIMASVVGGLGFTSATRAGVQSQASADAGIAAATAAVNSGDCAGLIDNPVYRSAAGTEPHYEAIVYRPAVVGSGWVRGCPVSDSRPVRIVSTGIAASLGVSGAERGDDTNVEVVLGMIGAPTAIDPSGPAIYAYSSEGFGGSGKLVSIDGSNPSVLVKQGNVVCSGASGAAADWVIEGGGFTANGSCGITGNIWSTGSALFTGAVNIGGSVVANGIRIEGSSKIGGSAWSTGSLDLSGGGSEIARNATAKSLDMQGSSRIRGDAWISENARVGSSRVDGRLTARSISTTGGNSSYIGSRNEVPSGPGTSPFGTPVAPVVPDWIDFGYDKNDWAGFSDVAISGTCDWTTFNNAIANLAAGPGIIDARGCNGPIKISDYQKLTLLNDLVIVANSFTLGGSSGFEATQPRKLWLITPDAVADGLPTCAAGDVLDLGGSFSIHSNIAVMLYSPCKVTVGSAINLRGQVFAGRTVVNGAATMGYVPLGLPNVDLSTGTSSNPSATNNSRSVVSLRNVSAG